MNDQSITTNRRLYVDSAISGHHRFITYNLSCPVADFQEDSGRKGADFPEYFRGYTRARQMLVNICQLHVFFTRKGVQESRGSSKRGILLLKALCIWPLISLCFSRICRLDGIWGHFPPPCPPYSC